MDEYLSDAEKVKVASFMKDATMVEAVKKVLLAGIYYNGVLQPGMKANPAKNFALSFDLSNNSKINNEQLGQDIRARIEGIAIVENSFKELGKIAELASMPKAKKEKNPAL